MGPANLPGPGRLGKGPCPVAPAAASARLRARARRGPRAPRPRGTAGGGGPLRARWRAFTSRANASSGSGSSGSPFRERVSEPRPSRSPMWTSCVSASLFGMHSSGPTDSTPSTSPRRQASSAAPTVSTVSASSASRIHGCASSTTSATDDGRRHPIGFATAAVQVASIRWRIQASSRSPRVRRRRRAPMRSENWRNSVIGRDAGADPAALELLDHPAVRGRDVPQVDLPDDQDGREVGGAAERRELAGDLPEERRDPPDAPGGDLAQDAAEGQVPLHRRPDVVARPSRARGRRRSRPRPTAARAAGRRTAGRASRPPRRSPASAIAPKPGGRPWK